MAYTYNSDGSGITSVTDAAGGATYYGYDAASNLSQITDADHLQLVRDAQGGLIAERMTALATSP